jgi:hypothetical protein
MADSQSRFAALPARQKITIVVFLLVFIFVVWQVIGMFRGNSDNSSVSPAIAASKPTAPMSSAAPKTVIAQAAPAAAPGPTTPPPGVHKEGPSALPPGPGPAPGALPSAPPPKVAPTKSPDQAHPVAEKVLPQTEFLIQQEQIQGKYVAALNDLQMLKIQREIAETSQAIVAAKLATATAEKSISALLAEAQAAVEPPPPPTGKKGASGATSANVEPSGSGPPPMPELSEGGYSVESVSMEQDQWHAVIKFKDKLYDVSVGDMLPPDRSLVKAIDQKGVTLDSSGMEQKLPLTVNDTDASTTGGGSSGGGALPP